MSYCAYCGQSIPDDGAFCPYCGKPVHKASAPVYPAVSTKPTYNYEKERLEALNAGEKALDSLYAAGNELRKARNWGFVDLLGGGVISSLAKRSKMENAQAYIEQAKRDLRLFSKELQDVAGFGGLNIDTDDFLSFADWFFDGFVVDFMVQERINKAAGQVDDAIRRVENAMHRLQG